jgi:hypothetical protein
MPATSLSSFTPRQISGPLDLRACIPAIVWNRPVFRAPPLERILSALQPEAFAADLTAHRVGASVERAPAR